MYEHHPTLAVSDNEILILTFHDGEVCGRGGHTIHSHWSWESLLGKSTLFENQFISAQDATRSLMNTRPNVVIYNYHSVDDYLMDLSEMVHQLRKTLS